MGKKSTYGAMLVSAAEVLANSEKSLHWKLDHELPMLLLMTSAWVRDTGLEGGVTALEADGDLGPSKSFQRLQQGLTQARINSEITAIRCRYNPSWPLKVDKPQGQE
jgi:hypothetical protein